MNRAIGHSDGATCNISFEFAQPECPTRYVKSVEEARIQDDVARDAGTHEVEMRRILLLTVLEQWPLNR
jgi:hypothetical protein